MQRTCDSAFAHGAVTGERTVEYHLPNGIQEGTKTIVVLAVGMDVVVIFVLVGQICDLIVGLVVKAPILA